MLRSLLTDLGEVGTVITKNNDLKKPEQQGGAEGKIEEEFTVARLYVSKMKSEVKNLVHKATLLEQAQSDGSTRTETLEKELSESRLLIGESGCFLQSHWSLTISRLSDV
jgi:kinesin family protein 5